MTYDLTNPLHRKQFVARANKMLENHCNCAELTDVSKRSLNQNRYLHVLIRMLALETGVTEQYSKDMYFKRFANPKLFVREHIDPITKKSVEFLRSTADLSVEEMTTAINTFRVWSEQNGYYLPEAMTAESGDMVFATAEDERAFFKGKIEADRADAFLSVKD